jgi:hypothetical protein
MAFIASNSACDRSSGVLVAPAFGATADRK